MIRLFFNSISDHLQILLTVVMIFISSQEIFSQQIGKEIDLDDFVQNLFSQQDEDFEYNDLYESLFQLYRHPLNLNKASRSELESLYILSENQIKNLLFHIQKYGRLLSIWELQAVEGFDLFTLNKLLPFVTVKDKGLQSDNRTLFNRILEEENQFLLLRYERILQTQRGFTPKIDSTDSRYLGSPDKLYARYRNSHTKDFSIGFTLEKDAGEQLIWDANTSRYVADFISYHATFYHQGNFKAIAIGDYQIQIGQGLLLAAGFQIGKGAETTAAVRRGTTGIRPFTSVLESGYFRGAAATYGFGKLELTSFYSSQKLDANVQNETDSVSEFDDFISTIYQTGFHRTQREINNKNQIRERVGGLHLNYQNAAKNLSLGSTILTTNYERPFVRQLNDYNQFAFRGKSNLLIGANASYNWQNISFLGEIGRSQSGGIGFIAGFVSSLSQTVELALLFRNYDRDFHSFYGSAFGEVSRNNNEKGLYWGFKFKPSRKWILAAYYDQFWFPWLRFQADAPSQGNEYLIRLMHRPTKKLIVYAQYRYENRGRNLQNNETNIDLVVPTKRQNYLVNLDFKSSDYISLRTRLQYSSYQQEERDRTEGIVLLQDVNFDWGKFRLSTRFALFDTDDFNNRQYVYEKDVLYSFSFPAYFGQGFRNYFLIRYKVNRKTDFWAKYATSQFRNQDFISSGLNRIEGNTRSDITLQMRYKF